MSDDTNEVVSYMETYRTMPEVIFPVPATAFGDNTVLQIHVTKSGGGAPDHKYTGTWICELHHEGNLIHSTAHIDTGMPHSHYMVAGVYADSLQNGDMFTEKIRERLFDFASVVDVETEGIL